MSQAEVPWPQLPVLTDSTLLIGAKCSGKQQLCHWMVNAHDAVILDCDLDSNFPGSVSLYGNGFNEYLWVGETVPWAQIPNYLFAIATLYKLYRREYFTKSLVIRTNNHLTGLGQLLLYHIYSIVKPFNVLFLHGQATHQSHALQSIQDSIANKSYVERLHFQIQREVSSCKISHYHNKKTKKKNRGSKYFKWLFGEEINNVGALVEIIHSGTLKQIQLKDMTICQKVGASVEYSVQMRIVVLCSEMEKGTLGIRGLGYAYGGRVFYHQGKIIKKIGEHERIVGVIGQNLDFQKNFYNIMEEQLIDIEMQYGRIPYICKKVMALGSKGMRNNPAKKN